MQAPHDRPSAETVLDTPWNEIVRCHPQLVEFFDGYGITVDSPEHCPRRQLDNMDHNRYEDLGLDRTQLLDNLRGFLDTLAHLFTKEVLALREVNILGGHDKDGRPESHSVTLAAGTITGIVGPTGSGKSRLLADIEWLAQNDTPTGRTIFINGVPPDPGLRFEIEHRIVAQLSQNMNFVMDASAEEFIHLHAESRMITEPGIVARIIDQANNLAGEPFSPQTPVTSLSGGQSRALMIADTAFLSRSPIVLIDEIENAGIDRKKALRLLCSQEKIVLIATHDPVLALMCSQRLVIRNGAITQVIQTSDAERQNLTALERLDAMVHSLRAKIRAGERIEHEIALSATV